MEALPRLAGERGGTMRWTFEREARWMLVLGLLPAIAILLAIVFPRLLRLLGW
jgi:hypothetical protein